MKMIWKFPFMVEDMVVLSMPAGARILHVDEQLGHVGKLCVWAVVEVDRKKVDRYIRVVGTGNPINFDSVNRYQFINTVLTRSGLVWHVWIEREDEVNPGQNVLDEIRGGEVKKKKIYITTDEWWPVYEISTKRVYSAIEVEVNEDTLKRWKRVFTDFARLQKKMEKLAEK